MAKAQQALVRPWSSDLVPLIVVVLIVVHVVALVYWIFRLATEKPPERKKKH